MAEGKPYPTLKRPATADHLRSKPKPWKIVDLHGDIDAVRALEDALQAHLKASMAIPSDVGEQERHARLATHQEAVDKARERVEKTTTQVLVAAAGRRRKRAIDEDEAHAPREKDHEGLRQQMREAGQANWETAQAQFNGDTYPLALMAASLVTPSVETPGELEELLEDWTDGEIAVLWAAVVAVNQDATAVDWSKKSVTTNGYGRS